MSDDKPRIPTARELVEAIHGDGQQDFGERPDIIGAVVAPSYSSGLVTTLDDGETTAGTKAFPAILPLNSAPSPGDKLIKLKVGSSYVVAKIGTPTAAASPIPVGSGSMYFGAAAPSGYLLADGKTIGDGSSGGTSRANADTQTLFELLWNSTTNTELVIQTSAGAGTTRGASATADFNAHKRIPLPDLRGRFPLGLDNMGGTSANRVTSAQADLLAGNNGAETHTITTSEMPSHSHNLHIADGGANPSANSVNTASVVSNTSSGGFMDTAGSGSAMNIMNPYLAVNFIIKY